MINDVLFQFSDPNPGSSCLLHTCILTFSEESKNISTDDFEIIQIPRMRILNPYRLPSIPDILQMPIIHRLPINWNVKIIHHLVTMSILLTYQMILSNTNSSFVIRISSYNWLVVVLVLIPAKIVGKANHRSGPIRPAVCPLVVPSWPLYQYI